MAENKQGERPLKIDFFSIATILHALFLAHQFMAVRNSKDTRRI